MGVDLGIKRLQIHLEQGPQQHRHGDDVEKHPRRGRQLLGREGRQLAELVGLRQVAQQVNAELGAERARPAVDVGGEIREAVRLGDGEPHQADPVGIEAPMQQGRGNAGEALLDGRADRRIGLELGDA